MGWLLVARISDRLLIQLVDDRLVIMDDSGGEEIVIHRDEIPGFLAACQYLVSVIQPPIPPFIPPKGRS